MTQPMTPTPAVSAKEKAREAAYRRAWDASRLSDLGWEMANQNASPLSELAELISAIKAVVDLTLSATEGEAWFCGGCGQTDPSKRCLGCLHDMRASPPSAPAGVKVKPLEWVEGASMGGSYAESAVATYFAYRDGSWTGPARHTVVTNGTLDKAKAAAQADYEQRIRSSLQPDTQAAPKVHHLGAALQMIADEHASVLTPRQIEALYQAAAKLWPPDTQAAAASAPAQEGRADG